MESVLDFHFDGPRYFRPGIFKWDTLSIVDVLIYNLILLDGE